MILPVSGSTYEETENVYFMSLGTLNAQVRCCEEAKERPPWQRAKASSPQPQLSTQ